MHLDAIGNVLTAEKPLKSKNGIAYQWLDEDREQASCEPVSICVKQDVQFSKPESKARRLSRKRRSGRKARRQKRGPKGSTCLTWDQVKSVDSELSDT